MTRPDPASVAAACHLADDYLAIRQRVLRVPGVQAAVALGSELMLDTAHGLADIEADVELMTDHLFRIASHSKTFTATILMQLVEQERLRLDDRVGEHVRGLPAPVAALRLRELLAHGSGITRDGRDADHWNLNRAFPDAREFVESLSDASVICPANERFKYSNVGFSLLGMVIEQVTGRGFAEELEERITRPLGLADTAGDVIAGREGDYATAYSSLAYGDRRVPIDTIGTGIMAAATGVTSTARDTARYFAAHTLGDERLLSDASKRLLQRREWTVEDADADGYGLGFSVAELDGRHLIGHGGGFPGHITNTLLDPEYAVAVSVFTNAIDGPAAELAAGVMKLIHRAADEAVKPAGDVRGNDRPHVDIDRFTGAFADLWHRFDVVRFGGRLVGLNLNQADPTRGWWELTPVDDTTLRLSGGGANGFSAVEECLTYSFAPDGSVASVRLAGGTTVRPLDAFRADLDSRDRIRVGDAP